MTPKGRRPQGKSNTCTQRIRCMSVQHGSIRPGSRMFVCIYFEVPPVPPVETLDLHPAVISSRATGVIGFNIMSNSPPLPPLFLVALYAMYETSLIVGVLTFPRHARVFFRPMILVRQAEFEIIQTAKRSVLVGGLA